MNDQALKWGNYSGAFMDLTSLKPLLEILGAIVTVLTAFFGLPKLISELQRNRVAEKKLIADLFQEMTELKYDKPIHPIVIQTKFQAAIGGPSAYIPKAPEILAFLRDETLATLPNALDFAYCLEFVAYSESTNTFEPRSSWTTEKLAWRKRRTILYYLLLASPAVALIAAPAFHPSRLLLILPLVFYAVMMAVRAKQIAWALRLIQKAKNGVTNGEPPSINGKGPTKTQN